MTQGLGGGLVSGQKWNFYFIFYIFNDGKKQRKGNWNVQSLLKNLSSAATGELEQGQLDMTGVDVGNRRRPQRRSFNLYVGVDVGFKGRGLGVYAIIKPHHLNQQHNNKNQFHP